MSSTKRRINSTGRRRISRECVKIDMLECLPDEPLKAKASLQLHKFDFQGTASVVIEAYHRSSGMRFDCGTIEALKVPEILVLSEVDRSGSVLFRLKVVDNDEEPGRLLGSAEGIRPRSEEDKEGNEGRRSILPVRSIDLRHDVWKVEIEYGDGPKLILNTRIPDFRYKFYESGMMQGIILPAALRFILQELVRSYEVSDDDDEFDWKEDWMTYCQDELQVTGDLQEISEAGKKDWIDDVVMRFCEKFRFVEKVRKKLEGM